MKSIQKIVDYTNTLTHLDGEIRYCNPNYFERVKKCDAFYSTDPKIIEAYNQAGIPMYQKEISHGVQQEEKQRQEKEIDYSVLTWNELRRLAAEKAGIPIKNKNHALEVLAGL